MQCDHCLARPRPVACRQYHPPTSLLRPLNGLKFHPHATRGSPHPHAPLHPTAGPDNAPFPCRDFTVGQPAIRGSITSMEPFHVSAALDTSPFGVSISIGVNTPSDQRPVGVHQDPRLLTPIVTGFTCPHPAQSRTPGPTRLNHARGPAGPADTPRYRRPLHNTSRRPWFADMPRLVIVAVDHPATSRCPRYVTAAPQPSSYTMTRHCWPPKSQRQKPSPSPLILTMMGHHLPLQDQ